MPLNMYEIVISSDISNPWAKKIDLYIFLNKKKNIIEYKSETDNMKNWSSLAERDI